jgi:hypothetical protein
MQQLVALDRAKQIRLDFGADGVEFTFRDPQGGEWDSRLEQWIGNGSFPESGRTVSKDERQYIVIGVAESGADLILLSDDAAVICFNDADQTFLKVADSVDEFVALLPIFPRTMEAAVDLVISRMSDDLKELLRCIEGDEVDFRVQLAAGFTTGMSVRALLGLWGKNPELLAQLPRYNRHPDSASSYILVECWRRLRAESTPKPPA